MKGGSTFRGGGRGRGGETLPYLAYTGQLCAAEHKVLSINQGVELYYFNSKNLIIYFMVLIVKFYFNSKFTVSFWAGSLKKTVKASDEQFTFAIPIIFFQSFYFRDVSLKNYLILYVKQNKKTNQCQNLKQCRGLKISAAQLFQDLP